MERAVAQVARLRGEIIPPGDKSISHRAAIFNAIAEGEARVTNFSTGEDCLSTVRCLRALGAAIDVAEEPGGLSLSIAGVGGQGLLEPSEVLDAGNSGTTMRLLAGLLAAQPFLSIITGDASLRSRPMDRIVQPLRAAGAQIWGRQGDRLAPLAIRGGNLQGMEHKLPVASAQVKSCLLIAGLYAGGPTLVEEPAPTRDHTERLLEAMGARLTCQGTRITIQPSDQPLQACDIAVPGDISAAAYWLVAAAVHPDAEIIIRNVGMNPSRTGVVDALREMGADLSIEDVRELGGEPVANLRVRSSELRAIEVGGAMVPRLIDEIPVLALAATAARGTTVFRDASELRVKESDRISNTVALLSRLGAKAEELPDGIIVHGGTPLQGTRCDSVGDHRLAMTLGVAGLVARGETIITGAESASISYPVFWDEMQRLAKGLPTKAR
ncbi:MAG: 3-phosphoshikimate 1-carboxyvinyltransferase [Chloroflexi bacterium]|nr:3-phosphoshikimate 1-carboxyvinyltransferase [Chloroflexota bacterium]